MNVTIFCATAGLDIEKCVNNIDIYAAANTNKRIKYYCLEKAFHEPAKSFLDKIISPPLPNYKLVHVLMLPCEELKIVCHEGLEIILNNIKNEFIEGENIILSLHPVLYHQITKEYVQPYSPSAIKESLSKYSIGLNCIVSLHDDIFDVYRNLMKDSSKLFHPDNNRDPEFDEQAGRTLYKREPEKDLVELRQILDWRDRELSTTRYIARSIGVDYFLFHRKARIKSLWDVVFNQKPCVYFSHPISQPRRDINNTPHPVKCLTPSVERGKKFIMSCQHIANTLGKFVPLIQPTDIDELRLNSIQEIKNKEKTLNEHILPPLTQRWPIGDGDRIGDPIDSSEDKQILLGVEPSIFNERVIEDVNAEHFKYALKLLEEEILRQINVRDHILSFQAKLIFVYRPYSLPNSGEATGGVMEEINTLLKKEKLGKDLCKPALIIYHPKKDEIQRRENEFTKLWDSIANKYFQSNTNLDNFKQECLLCITGFGNDMNLDGVADEIKRQIKECQVKAISVKEDSSMAGEGLLAFENVKDKFCSDLIKDSTILISHLQSECSKNPELIKIIDKIESEIQLAKRIEEIIGKD